ncbi:MAG: universal stress protein [Syntrophales bacterium]|nr:universal stress protein [Syntrophales bacterium]
MKLLYATNLEENTLSFSMIEDLLALKRAGLEEIVFLQTIPDIMMDKSETKSRRKWLADLSDLGIKSSVLTEEVLSLPGILNAAKKEEVSLIVVNLDRTTNNPSRSSLIKNLIKTAPIPILIINDSQEAATAKDKGFFDHVVFTTDWSPASEKALTYLLGFKEILGAVEIVNVINGKLTVRDMRELKEKLAHTRKICLDENIDAESHIYAGQTSEEIITASKDYRATLIVLGAISEKPLFKKIFKKSSTYMVAEEAAVPVLIVP